MAVTMNFTLLREIRVRPCACLARDGVDNHRWFLLWLRRHTAFHSLEFRKLDSPESLRVRVLSLLAGPSAGGQ